MAQAKRGDTVKVHYTGKLQDGSVFDSSIKREPLQFTLGARQVVPGFEEGVLGMDLNETKTVTIPPEKAYGQHYEKRVATFPLKELPSDIKPELDKMVYFTQPDGRRAGFKVTKLTKDSVTFDGNHPLAGKALIFEITLVEIVPAC
ncbi:MAG: peptidylprolyl isomerase [Planctomycetes bacterium]|nr:peptidylprolyl isomerase [Planctomycetota bacterium]